MNQAGWMLVSALVLGFLPPATPVCPWEMAELENWSNVDTWLPGEIPATNASVVIPAGKKIVLDAPIPRLLTLTINGTLVWGNVDGIRLETSYILVNGEFHIGSEDCHFDKTADIFLYGQSNAPEMVSDFGRKFIGAASGSKLEIHGEQKQSWTKLVETVEPVRMGSCGYVYDSRDENLGTRLGLHIHVWNFDGTVYDTHQYNTAGTSGQKKAKNMVKYIAGTPAGKIIAVAVYRTMGVPSPIFDELYTSIESLGGWKIRDVEEFEPYVLLAETGNTSNAIDNLNKRYGVAGGLDASAALPIGDLVFKVTSISYNTNYFDETIFRVVHKVGAFPRLSFLHNVSSWHKGDEIVVASTDFDWKQAEIRTIVECTDCADNQVRVDGDFRYSHFGEVTFGVDERAEVGLLSRNIRIEGELQDQCYNFTSEEGYLCDRFKRDTFGGHTQILKGAFARIEGAQLRYMGNQHEIAQYPLHFHMCDDVPGQYIRNNVIRDSNSRCITIHGTDYLEVSNNVCLNHLGHGIFLEDSAEQNNTIHRNLVIGTQHGNLLYTDRHKDWCEIREYCNLLSSIWVSHPNNIVTENVAAGSDGYGITLTFSDRPLGLSLQRQKDRGLYQDRSTRYIKVKDFSKNVIHSNKKDGLWFDSRVSYGQTEDGVFIPENAKIGLNYYSPREPPNAEGQLVETLLEELTLYKNDERNSWLRCGNVAIVNSSFADSRISYLAAHSTAETSCDVRHSIFIGQTANKGEPLTYIFNDPQFEHLPKSERPRHHFDQSFAEDRP
ncbi:transmembrane protein 2-like [Plakobranchus ocellatus]|uniref:Transmembrane protein 2-like n=1 Tax=Plakobranchus ocellatus TaxID=259542 RepID=A0AAV4AEB6_9GAST|nr:transmembrane protein 2-like [Plakobranchus ocellatus]